MKFGLSWNTGFLGNDPVLRVAAARHAEACGFESFYVPEHIALYPGAALGTFTIPATMPVADPLQCLGFVAAVTTRLLLGTSVLLLPYHHPVALAKRLATLDVLSKGRMRLLTVGGGALPGGAGGGGGDFAPRARHRGAAAGRAGLRGDGYFPGGRLTPAERDAQLELMRVTASAAGRDAGALE